MSLPEGLLLIDKPIGWTSFDVVNKVRSIIAREAGLPARRVKVGHTGTLDPAASGLLVICVGKKYTSQSARLTASDKQYLFTARFGGESSTGDLEGQISPFDGPKPSLENLKEALRKHQGLIWQTPPRYSAIKIAGQRAYQRARKGQEFQIPKREVEIQKIELVDYQYPDFTVRCRVSKGTYVRTLAEDIAKSLSSRAYLTSLRREELAKYDLQKAISPEDLDIQKIKKWLISSL